MPFTALDPFRALLESVPQWISEIEDIMRACASSIEVLPDHSVDLIHKPPSIPCDMLVSTPHRSMASLPRSHESTSQLVRVQETAPKQADVEDSPQRKRKATSPGPNEREHPFRQRDNRVREVVYNGQVQKQFERMVLSIGVSRNGLRRGKVTATVDLLSRRALHPEYGQSAAFGDMIGIDGHSISHTDSSPLPKVPALRANKEQTIGFDRVDKSLEKGQDILEKAAFLVLRQGQADSELKVVRRYLESAAELARAELNQAEALLDGTQKVNGSHLQGENTIKPDVAVGVPPLSAELKLEVDTHDQGGENPVDSQILEMKMGLRATGATRSMYSQQRLQKIMSRANPALPPT